MQNLILPILLLALPSIAGAECGIAASESGLSIVVHGKSGNCFSSLQFREAFRQMLQDSVRTMEAGHAARAPGGKTEPAQAARGTVTARLRHEGPSGAPYYGQK